MIKTFRFHIYFCVFRIVCSSYFPYTIKIQPWQTAALCSVCQLLTDNICPFSTGTSTESLGPHFDQNLLNSAALYSRLSLNIALVRSPKWVRRLDMQTQSVFMVRLYSQSGTSKCWIIVPFPFIYLRFHVIHQVQLKFLNDIFMHLRAFSESSFVWKTRWVYKLVHIYF